MQSMSQYTTNRLRNENITADITNTEYVLLPVWMVNVKYGGEFYTFAINAQTGVFFGNIPVDKKKAVMYGVMIFLIVFVIISVISYLIFIGG